MSLHQSVVFPWLGLCAAVAVITPNALVLTALNTYAPTLSPISDQVMDEDTSIVLSLVVGDAETDPANLRMAVTTSNGDAEQTIPARNIVFGGEGANRTATLTPQPNRYGTVFINISVSDGERSTGHWFTVVVSDTDESPLLTVIPHQRTAEDTSTGALPITLASDLPDLTWTEVTSNPNLVSLAGIAIGGTGTSRTVTITPQKDRFGLATIRIIVSDGKGTSTFEEFTVTITAVNDAPVIANVVDQTTEEDSAIGVPIVVGDVDNSAASLVVAAVATYNRTLVPDSGLVVNGTGGVRHLYITPAPNLFGSTTIRVTVTDGMLTSVDEFVLAVRAVNDAPTIQSIPSATVPQGWSGGIPFMIGDVETSADSLTLSAVASNVGLLPPENLTLSGSGRNRLLKVVLNPAAAGQTTITVSVRDEQMATAFTTTTLTVTPNSAPTLFASPAVTLTENTTASLAVTISDVDVLVTPASALTLTVAAVDTTLFPSGSIVTGGSDASRTVTLNPAPDREGSTMMTLTVSDGHLHSSRPVAVTVTRAAVPNPPTSCHAIAIATAVQVSWLAPAEGAVPTFYVVEIGQRAGTTTLPVINTRSRTPALNLALPPASYVVRVRSGNSTGVSDPCPEAPIMVTSGPNLPGAPLALSVSVDGGIASASWEPPVGGGEIAFWRVEAETPVGARAADVPFDLRNITAAVGAGAYNVRVRGVGAAGVGPASNDVSFAVFPDNACTTRPEPPTLLPATVTGSLVTLTWRPPPNAASARYAVLGSSTPLGVDVVIARDTVASFSMRLPPGIYYASVVAVTACGSSERSNVLPVVVVP